MYPVIYRYICSYLRPLDIDCTEYRYFSVIFGMYKDYSSVLFGPLQYSGSDDAPAKAGTQSHSYRTVGAIVFIQSGQSLLTFSHLRTQEEWKMCLDEQGNMLTSSLGSKSTMQTTHVLVESSSRNLRRERFFRSFEVAPMSCWRLK